MHDKDDPIAPIEVNRSDALFLAAIELGLPVEVHEKGGRARVYFNGQHHFGRTESCNEYYQRCWEQIHDQTMGITWICVEAYNAGQMDAGTLEVITSAARDLEIECIGGGACDCGPAQGQHDPGPPQPPWKQRTVNVHGVPVTWHELGEAAKRAAAVGAKAGAAAIAVRLAFGAPGAGWKAAIIAITTVGATWTVAGALADQLPKDPPDQNFNVVPSVVRPDRMQLDLTALAGSTQSVINVLLDQARDEVGLLVALRTALERSWAAELAGQFNARRNQLVAATDFANQLATVLEQRVAARSALVADLRANDLVMTIDRNMMAQVVVPFSKGPPDEFIAAVNHYGLGTLDPSTVWWQSVAHVFDGEDVGAGVFPEMLNPPEAALAEAQLAEHLRKSTPLWA